MTSPLTPTERHDHGHLARKQLPRRAHAAFDPRRRKRTALELVRASTRGRVPALIVLKNERMAMSPFAYFRGAVPVMAPDLAQSPHTGMINQICGDAHVRNLGAYASPDGQLVFDINDFDETIRGPFEWDVKRLATSLVLAARELHAKDSTIDEATLAFLSRYRRSMRMFAGLPVTGLAHYQVHRIDAVGPLVDILAKAQRATPLVSLGILTEPGSTKEAGRAAGGKDGEKKDGGGKDGGGKDGGGKNGEKEKGEKGGGQRRDRERRDGGAADMHLQHRPGEHEGTRRFRELPPELTRVTGKTAQQVLDALRPYIKTLEPERRHFLAQYRPIDVAFKVVGTGSVGLRDYCVYLEGNGAGDPIFLQVKEETASAYAAYLPGGAGRSKEAGVAGSAGNNGRRVMEGARAMQFESDPFLGYTSIEGRDYLVRQLNDHKASIDFEEDSKDLRAAGLTAYADLCGELLARGHARSGDPIALAAYVGNSPRFDHAIATFAVAYANQTEKDWRDLKRSLRGGKKGSAAR